MTNYTPRKIKHLKQVTNRNLKKEILILSQPRTKLLSSATKSIPIIPPISNLSTLLLPVFNNCSSSVCVQSFRHLRPHEPVPPADRTLPLPRSRDGPGLQLLRSRFLQPAAWRGLREVIPVFLILGAVPEVATSGKKNCHTSMTKNSVSPDSFRCRCNPIGSSSEACHPLTGHCVCHPGVEGTLCDSCRVGFFGFSSHGCRGAGLQKSAAIS